MKSEVPASSQAVYQGWGVKLRLPPHRASSDPLVPGWPGQHNLGVTL